MVPLENGESIARKICLKKKFDALKNIETSY